jgi:two-component system KDP operon response regulator KdpE
MSLVEPPHWEEAAVTSVALFSDDTQLLQSFPRGFECQLIEPRSGAAGVVQARASIFLVDARRNDAITTVRQLADHGHYPIIVMGGSSDPREAERYLDAGADDYVTASAREPEFAARLRAAARRRGRVGGSDEDRVYVYGDVTISLTRHEVRKGDQPLRLTPTEFRLLDVLANHNNQVVPHRKLMAAVWGLEHLSSRHYLRVYIRQLRRKLESDPDQPEIIRTDWGRGYELRCEERTTA